MAHYTNDCIIIIIIIILCCARVCMVTHKYEQQDKNLKVCNAVSKWATTQMVSRQNPECQKNRNLGLWLELALGLGIG